MNGTARTVWMAVAGTMVSAAGLVLGGAAPASASFPDTPYPQAVLNHVMRTIPFNGSTVSMNDDEGSAYVPRDNSLWLADDDGHRIYEVNPTTGALKRSIGDDVLSQVKQLGGGPVAGKPRDRDLEALAYDAAHDTLYLFSGKCCNDTVLPTAFRLSRDKKGTFQVDSYQPLAAGSDYTGAAWNPGDGNVYVGVGPDLRTYDYATNVAGPTFQVPKLSRITGMSFSADGSDLWVTHSLTKLSRMNWSTKTLVPGWTFDLGSTGILDARAVEIINDELWVSDGYDFRTAGDPLDHAVFVYDITLPPPDYNIVGNPGFESGTSGWNANNTAGVTLTQSPGGHSGSYAGRLTNTNATPATMTLNDSPNWVVVSTNKTYTAHAWVRSDNTTAPVVLQLREYDGSVLVGQTTTTVAATNGWQQLTATIVPTRPGTSTIDLNVYSYKQPAGTTLDIDDVVLNIS